MPAGEAHLRLVLEADSLRVPPERVFLHELQLLFFGALMKFVFLRHHELVFLVHFVPDKVEVGIVENIPVFTIVLNAKDELEAGFVLVQREVEPLIVLRDDSLTHRLFVLAAMCYRREAVDRLVAE